MTKISSMLSLWEKLLTKKAQQTSQSGDVEDALRASGLFDISQQVAPLLNEAGIPGDASVDISMRIDRHLNPIFPVQTNPPSQAMTRLSSLLKQHFANPVKQALTKANISIADSVSLKWLRF